MEQTAFYTGITSAEYESFQAAQQRAAEIKAKKDLRFLGNMSGMAIMLFIIFNSFIGLFLVSFKNIYNLYLNNPAFESAMNIIASFFYIGIPFAIIMGFTKLKYKDIRYVPLSKPDIKRTILSIPIGLAFCMLANFVANLITMLFSSAGVTLTQPESPSANAFGAFEIILCFLGTAIMPALMEEFALRGTILQPARKYGTAFAVISSSVIFGIMHQNMIQAPFAAMVGLGLGFFAVKTGSLWAPIFIHCFNNAYSVTAEIIKNRVPESTYNTIFYSATAAIIVLGIIAVVILLVTDKEFFKRETYDVPDENGKILTKFQKFYCYFVNAPMIISIAIMIITTVKTVKIGG